MCAKAPTTVLAQPHDVLMATSPPFVHFMECPFVSTNARQRAFLCTATYLGSAQMTTRRDSTQGSRETHVHTETKTDQQKDSDRDTIRENGKRRTETLDTLCRQCTLCYRQPCTHIYQRVPKKSVITRWSHRQVMSKGETVMQSLDGFLLLCVTTDTDRSEQRRESALSRLKN